MRVAVWSTGGVGKLAVQAVANRPDLDLVGVWVHSSEKVGLDAGVIAGAPPVGVLATDDAEALLDAKPDCVVYAASGPERDEAAVSDIERILAAGVNVVAVSVAGLVYPDGYDAAYRQRLAEAASTGEVSLYASGIEPGFAGDQLPLTLLTLSHTVRSIRTQELFLYSGYPVTFVMEEVFGFGRPMDFRPIMSMPGVQSGTWGPPVEMVAAALGETLDEIRETYDRQLTPRSLDVACGTIPAGTVGAVRFETIGVIDGRDAIVIEHVNRMAPDLAPDWPTADRDGIYRIQIEGDPALDCELAIGTPDTVSQQGLLATTMRLVNAIPYVVRAEPGLRSSLDLPLTVPEFAFVDRPAVVDTRP